MNNLIPDGPLHIEIIFVILSVTICFSLYYVVIHAQKITRTFRVNHDEENTRLVLFRRLMGVLFFGIIPLFLTLFLLDVPLWRMGINRSFPIQSLYYIIFFGLLALIINLLTARGRTNQNMYPQIRRKAWGITLLILNLVSWAAYLLSYEFMFRGFLLFPVAEIYGEWTAVILNISIYALAHLYKGPGETFGSLLMGFVLCMVTLHTRSIWTAFIIHYILAVSNEMFSFLFNPAFQFKKDNNG